MKIGFVWDTTIALKSFYVKNKTAYSYEDNKPYFFHHGVDPNCFLAGYNYAWLGDGGSFINLNEWEDKKLPDEDFDLILYSNERIGLDDDRYHLYHPQRLRDQYPNAKIVGNVKENYDSDRNHEVRKRNKIKFYKECDAITAAGVGKDIQSFEWYTKIEKETGMKFNWISVPINIDYFYEHFYSNEKNKCIYAYLPNPLHRRGTTYKFAESMGKKYNIPVKYKPLQSGQKFDYLSQKEFINLWKDCLFHFNLDPMYEQPGIQGMQVAAVGSLNIGGHNDTHRVLFPNTATTNEEVLEERFAKYLEDTNTIVEDLSYAWEKLNEYHSFSAVEKSLQELVERI